MITQCEPHRVATGSAAPATEPLERGLDFEHAVGKRRFPMINMGNYAESIIKTISEPLLIMDKNFIIKSANPAFYNYFKTICSFSDSSRTIDADGREMCPG